MSDWMSRYRLFEAQAAGMHPEMSIQDFNYTIKISPRYQYAYAVTPKAGCTTLQKILADAEFGYAQQFTDIQYLHYREFLPYLSPMQIGDPRAFFTREDIYKFCFVRHPHTRLLSAYLDKIVRRKAQREPIVELLGKSTEEEISFAEFIDAVCRQPISEQDHHWRVQYYLTYQEGIAYDFIGRFEKLIPDIRCVLERLGIQKFAPADLLADRPGVSLGQHHATGADGLLDRYYTPDLKEKVRRKFIKDFTYFGYE